MNYAYHKKVINDVIDKMKELDIDLYLILSTEGSDPITSFVPGVDALGGTGAFFFIKDGGKYGMAVSINVQDMIESNLFDEVFTIKNYDSAVAEKIREFAPKTVALNYSENYAFCDGLKLGQYEKIIALMDNPLPFKIVSSDCFIPQVEMLNPKP